MLFRSVRIACREEFEARPVGAARIGEFGAHCGVEAESGRQTQQQCDEFDATRRRGSLVAARRCPITVQGGVARLQMRRNERGAQLWLRRDGACVEFGKPLLECAAIPVASPSESVTRLT